MALRGCADVQLRPLRPQDLLVPVPSQGEGAVTALRRLLCELAYILVGTVLGVALVEVLWRWLVGR